MSDQIQSSDSKVGDLKTVVKFAWKRTIVNGKRIWFKKYEQLYEYVVEYTNPSTTIMDYSLSIALLSEYMLTDEVYKELTDQHNKAKEEFILRNRTAKYYWKLIEEKVL